MAEGNLGIAAFVQDWSDFEGTQKIQIEPAGSKTVETNVESPVNRATVTCTAGLGVIGSAAFAELSPVSISDFPSLIDAFGLDITEPIAIPNPLAMATESGRRYARRLAVQRASEICSSCVLSRSGTSGCDGVS